MKIAILNENKILSRTIYSVLKSEGHEVIVYQDGYEASENIANDLPDIFITELIISFKAGVGLIADIRAIEQKYIKILVVSKLDQELAIHKLYEAGIDHFISTPIDFNSLIELVDTFFAKNLSLK